MHVWGSNLQSEETSAQHVPFGGLPAFAAGDGLDHTVLGARACLTCLVAFLLSHGAIAKDSTVFP